MELYKKIKLSDVARRAGVSNATISRYINNSGYVSEEKARLIKKAMNELGYTVSEGKEEKRCKVFAIVLPPSGKTLVGSAYQSNFSDLAQECGYKVMPEIYDLCEMSLIDVLKIISKQNIRGIFIPFMPMCELENNTVNYIKTSKIPIVMISEFPNIVYPEITSIIPDLQFAGKAAVKKLYEKGCRKLAFISTDAKKINHRIYIYLDLWMLLENLDFQMKIM